MPKASKSHSPTAAAARSSADAESPASESAANQLTTARSKKAAKKSGPSKGRGKKATPAEKRPAKQSGRSAGSVEPTDAEIQVRAYFIGERRIQQGLPGDSAADWLEAKTQLLQEARPSR